MTPVVFNSKDQTAWTFFGIQVKILPLKFDLRSCVLDQLISFETLFLHLHQRCTFFGNISVATTIGLAS